MTALWLILNQGHFCEGRTLIACTVLVVFMLSSCASSRMAQQENMPSSSAEGQQEIADLEQQIARGRVALGLPQRAYRQERMGESSSVAADQAAPAPPSPSMEAPLAPANEPMATASSEHSTSEVEGPMSAARDQSTKKAVCPGPCRFTQAICQAAERICRIAHYLGDSDARQRCQRAQADCTEARQATVDHCPDC